jgi:aminoglycoside/choline kinase family phosphotransferase
MPDRMAAITAFLANRPEVEWRRAALPVDASRRRYWRLAGPQGQSAILMDAEPETGESFDAFLAIGAHLNALGLCAPRPLAIDRTTGFLLLEDLGPDQVAGWVLRHPQGEAQLYEAATRIILTYTAAMAPPNLTDLTPKLAGDMIDLYSDWAATRVPAAKAGLISAMTEAYGRLVPAKRYLSLRDFHAENLIWRPTRSGSDRIGLLDFQDAFLAPRSYDLASFLRDPRRRVGDEAAESCIRLYIGQTGQSRAEFSAEYACVAAQRNLRILGIFHRLIKRDAKLKYAAFLSRVQGYLDQDLAHPALADLAKAARACGEVSA